MAEKRLIDAMQTVTKLSGRITPLIKMGENPMRVYEEVLQVIADAPTVDAVEVVHGWWIVTGGNRYTRVSQCSNCCAKYDFISPYCPNCGANMDGDGNG